MSIADRITAAQADIQEFQGITKQLADAQAALDTAQQQYQNDQQALKDASQKISDLSLSVAALGGTVAADDMKIEQLQSQLASAQSAILPSLQFVEGYESDVVQSPLPLPTDAVPLPESKHIGWYPAIGPKIGGQRPANHLAQMINGKLVLAVTGVPGKYCDVLWGNKRPALPPTVKDFALDFATLPVVAGGDQASVQCLEWDTLDVYQHMKGNLSSQRKSSTGELQIANGSTGGGWLNSGIVLDKFDLGVRHAIRWIYARDVVGKSVQYVAFVLDGKRYDIDPKVGKQPMYAEPIWGDQLTIQLQQDVNDRGGSFTTVFDSIKYVYRGNA